MKLDSRIKEKPFTMFDTDKAKEFIGKKGFFTNSLENFNDFHYNASQIGYGTLRKVSDLNYNPFFINGRDGFKYFLPEEFTEGLKILEVFYERKNDFK